MQTTVLHLVISYVRNNPGNNSLKFMHEPQLFQVTSFQFFSCESEISICRESKTQLANLFLSTQCRKKMSEIKMLTYNDCLTVFLHYFFEILIL